MNVTDVTQLPDNGKLQAVVLLLCAAGRPAGYESTTMPSYGETLLCFMVKVAGWEVQGQRRNVPDGQTDCRQSDVQWEC